MFPESNFTPAQVKVDSSNLITYLAPLMGQVPVISFFTVLSPTSSYIRQVMKLYIKYMVSLRCRLIVKKELTRLGLHIVELDLGMVEIMEDMTPTQRSEIQVILRRSGMHLLDENRSSLIERLRKKVMESVHASDPENLTPELLANQMDQDYTELDTVFSEVKGISLAQYINIHRIEKVKEFLLYDELSLVEIAQKLHFQNVAIMKHEFSKITGLKPSFFLQLKKKREETLKRKTGNKPTTLTN